MIKLLDRPVILTHTLVLRKPESLFEVLLDSFPLYILLLGFLDVFFQPHLLALFISFEELILFLHFYLLLLQLLPS